MGHRAKRCGARALVLGHDQIDKREPDRLLFGISEHGNELSIDPDQALLQARERHRVGSADEQLVEERRLVQQLGFAALALGDVVVRLEDSDGLARLVPLQRPPACHGELCGVSLGMDELPLPPVGAEQLRIDFCQRLGEARVQDLVSSLADRLLAVPPVEPLGTAIPISDDVVHVAHENRVMREVEEAGLLSQHRFGLLALDGDAREMGDLLDQAMLLRSRAARLAIVDREGPQHLALRGPDRRRPAGPQPVREGESAEIGPQRIRGDVADHHGLPAVSGRAARAYGRADRDAVDRLGIGDRQTGRRAVAQAAGLRIEQEDRRQRAARQLLDQPAQGVEDVGAGVAPRDHLEQPLLARERVDDELQPVL
jgi:hypothetical protein